MSQERTALRKLYADLVKSLDPLVVTDFYSKSLITSNEKENVEAEPTTTKKNNKLLTYLSKRPEKAMPVLIEVLEGEHGEDKLANETILRMIASEYPPYRYDGSQDIDTNTNTKPNGGSTIVKVDTVNVPSLPPLSPPGESSVMPVGRMHTPHQESTDGRALERYRVNSIPRGYCVIINNMNFHTMKARSGSKWDADALYKLFKSFLGFHVELFNDLTYGDILKLMDNVRSQDHSQLSCLAVCILSHGVEGEIYGTDGSLVSIKRLTSYFTGTQCPSLAGKPKIFILQACRGGKFDHGVIVEQTDGGETVESIDESIDEDAVLGEEETDYSGALPDESDFLLAYATTPGYVSWRNSSFGTWFIKAFTETMYDMAASEHLMDILTEVNRKVSEEYQSRGKDKQMPAPVTMLRYKLYLPPVGTK